MKYYLLKISNSILCNVYNWVCKTSHSLRVEEVKKQIQYYINFCKRKYDLKNYSIYIPMDFFVYVGFKAEIIQRGSFTLPNIYKIDPLLELGDKTINAVADKTTEVIFNLSKARNFPIKNLICIPTEVFLFFLQEVGINYSDFIDMVTYFKDPKTGKAITQDQLLNFVCNKLNEHYN